ncbi:MAG: hypothetical protein QM647_10780 [Asticcacaulis sp.]|uniref:hypothetical protein n=1 Tax=Asticcacaulis sp. TaxID=1872648 RepID=UPI0039E32BC1
MFDLGSLDPFIGYWSGGSEVAANPWTPSGSNRGRWAFRFDDARKNVIHDYEQSGPDGSGFDGHGVFCADPATEDLCGFWFDDRGLPPLNPARGKWQEGRLILYTVSQRGKARWTLYIEDNDLIYIIERCPIDSDTYSDVLRGRYHRS